MTVFADRALPPTATLGEQPALPAGYYVKSSAWGYAQVTPAIAGLLASAAGLGYASSAWLPLCIAGIIFCGYRLTFVVHDCSHRTLFAGRAANEVAGWIAASLLLVSFPIYRRLHWQHHVHYRRAGDPQGHDYNGLVPGRDRVLWHLAKPLVFANLVEKAGAFFAIQHAGLTAEERRQTTTATEAWQSRVAAMAAIVAAQLVVAGLSTGLGTRPFGYAWYLLPLITAGLFISRVRSYLEHGSLDPAHDAVRVARTHPSGWFERNVLAGLNFNYHNEHHHWPQVPSCRLPEVYRDITSRVLPDHDHSASYVASLRALIGACSRPRGH